MIRIFIFTLLLTTLFSAPKKSICLNMVVRDEKEVICRCLESVKSIIDYWVIVDTGSKDGTQEIIKSFMKNIPGELHERPWINFGHNREEALQLALSKGDYILFMDADDFLKFTDDFTLPNLTYDFYGIPSYSKDIECLLPRLIKSSIEWHWRDVLYEYLISETPTIGLVLEGVEYVYKNDGSRAKDPERFLKDIKILENALQITPSNARYMFYLALSYEKIGDFENALKYYTKRAEMDGAAEEIFVAKLNIGKLQNVLGFDTETVKMSLKNAYSYRPSRIEPLYYLVTSYQKTGKFQEAYSLARASIGLHSNDFLFVEKWIYDYGMLFEYALASYHLQKYPEAKLAFDLLLTRSGLPDDIKKESKRINEQIRKESTQTLSIDCLELL